MFSVVYNLCIFLISVLMRYAWLGIKDEPGCETAMSTQTND